jgi:hypothetical protein
MNTLADLTLRYVHVQGCATRERLLILRCVPAPGGCVFAPMCCPPGVVW